MCVQSFQKLLPVDGYVVCCTEPMAEDYEKSLTHLYQPLIGIEAVSLFQTLVHEYEIHTMEEVQTHHTLMNYMHAPLDIIYEARQKLEAIGLLKTFEQKENEHRLLTYMLISPFSPAHFFQDVMLQQLLYHHIGEDKFNHLKERFKQDHPVISGRNITASFYDVFRPFTPEYNPEIPERREQFNRELPIELKAIDLDFLEQSLIRRMIRPESVLNTANQKVIAQMATLYDLETFELEHALQWALDENNVFDQESFIEACEDLYIQKTGVANIQLQMKNEIAASTKAEKEPSNVTPIRSKEDLLLKKFETMSPREILEDFSSGSKASRQELKMIGEVMTDQGLPTPVMNVLIHYCLLQTGNEISRAYLESIASNWSRMNLKTAKEAMDYARYRRERVQKSIKQKSSPYPRHYQREVIPKWVEAERKSQNKKTQQEQEPMKKAVGKQEVISEQKRREQIASALEQFIDQDE